MAKELPDSLKISRITIGNKEYFVKKTVGIWNNGIGYNDILIKKMNVFLPKNLYKGIINYYLKKGKRSSILLFAGFSSEYVVVRAIDRDVSSHWGSPVSNNFGQSLYLSIERKPILVSSYSMMSQTGSNCYPRSWNFSVSNDNETWVESHSVNNSDVLEPNTPVLFKLEHPTEVNPNISFDNIETIIDIALKSNGVYHILINIGPSPAILNEEKYGSYHLYGPYKAKTDTEKIVLKELGLSAHKCSIFKEE